MPEEEKAAKVNKSGILVPDMFSAPLVPMAAGDTVEEETIKHNANLSQIRASQSKLYKEAAEEDKNAWEKLAGKAFAGLLPIALGYAVGDAEGGTFGAQMGINSISALSQKEEQEKQKKEMAAASAMESLRTQEKETMDNLKGLSKEQRGYDNRIKAAQIQAGNQQANYFRPGSQGYEATQEQELAAQALNQLSSINPQNTTTEELNSINFTPETVEAIRKHYPSQYLQLQKDFPGIMTEESKSDSPSDSDILIAADTLKNQANIYRQSGQSKAAESLEMDAEMLRKAPGLYNKDFLNQSKLRASSLSYAAGEKQVLLPKDLEQGVPEAINQANRAERIVTSALEQISTLGPVEALTTDKLEQFAPTLRAVLQSSLDMQSFAIARGLQSANSISNADIARIQEYLSGSATLANPQELLYRLRTGANAVMQDVANSVSVYETQPAYQSTITNLKKMPEVRWMLQNSKTIDRMTNQPIIDSVESKLLEFRRNRSVVDEQTQQQLMDLLSQKYDLTNNPDFADRIKERLSRFSDVLGD